MNRNSLFSSSLLLSLCFLTAFGQSPPSNDEPCGAIPLVCPIDIVNGSYLLSTSSMSDDCVWSEEKGDLWYYFEADGVSNYLLREFTDMKEVIQLFRADDCDGELIEVENCVVSDNFGSPEYFSAVYPAGEYYFRIRAFGVASQTFSFVFTCNTSPPNDQRCDAIPIECNETISGTTIGASAGGDVPFCGVSNTSPGVWYTYEALNSGTASFSLCNQANFSTRLSVYELTSCQDFPTCIAGNGNYNEGQIQCGNTSAVVNAPILAGNTYYILVHGWEVSAGNFQLSVICNNESSGCTDPTAINWNPSATLDDGSCQFTAEELICGEFLTETYCFSENDNSVFVYASESGEPVTLIFESAIFSDDGFENGGLRVYDGFNTNGELLFDFSDIFFEFDFPIITLEGFTYSGLSGGITIELFSGSFRSCEDGDLPPLVWMVGCGDIDVPGCTDSEAFNYVPTANIEDGSCIYAPLNDEACSALPLVCNGDALAGSILGASVSQEIVNDDCTDFTKPTEGDIWFSFEADGTSFYSVIASSGQFVISLFTGDDCENLIQAEPCENISKNYQGVFEEGTYYLSIRPKNNFSITDSYSVVLDCAEIPANDEICGAIELECNAGTLTQNVLGTTQSIDDDCTGNGISDVWYTFVADGISTYKIAETSAINRFISLYSANNCTDELVEIETCQLNTDYFEETFEAGRYYLRARPSNETVTIDQYNLEFTCTEPEFCDAVTGMEVQLSLGGINFIWNSIAGTAGCQHRVTILPEETLVAQYFQTEFEASQLFGPASFFDFNTEYEWKIRCACSLDPILAGAWSSFIFSTPSPSSLTISPNPTNGLSNVSFEVLNQERATLEVYDMKGRIVELLYQGVVSPKQTYRFEFDGTSLPNGVYLCRLTTAREVLIEKFIISK
jgi:hypothetical protein